MQRRDTWLDGTGFTQFTCHPHVYPRMEWAILHEFRKHSPDGIARARWRTSGSAYCSFIDPERMKGWVGLVGWPYSGRLTHISGHPSATGRAWDRESSPVKVLPLCSINIQCQFLVYILLGTRSLLLLVIIIVVAIALVTLFNAVSAFCDEAC